MSAPELRNAEKILLCGDATGDNTPLLDEAKAHEIEVIQVPGFSRSIHPRDLALFFSFLRILRRVRPDTLHTHSAKPFVLAGLAGFVCRVPHRFYSIHGLSFTPGESQYTHKAAALVERSAARLYSELISVNSLYAREFKRMNLKGLVRVIPNGVRPPRTIFRQRSRPGSPFTVLFAGRLEYKKDPEFMLAVASELIQKRGERHLRFHYVGDGPLRDAVAAGIKQRGLSDCVSLHGWLDDVEPWYAAADVIFVPSRSEACGLVMLEAGHQGCPAVGARVEGIPEVIESGVNGKLFEPGDVAGASDLIASLARTPSVYPRLSAGAELVARERSEETMVSQYLNLYAEHIARASDD
ncbi:MAG: glycosyltransferase [Ornithinimicrobium sp.]